MNGDLPLVIFCSLVQDRQSIASTDRQTYLKLAVSMH